MTASINNCIFKNNWANYDGGGAIHSFGSLLVNNCLFYENKISYQSWASAVGDEGNSTYNNCTFTKNGDPNKSQRTFIKWQNSSKSLTPTHTNFNNCIFL